MNGNQLVNMELFRKLEEVFLSEIQAAVTSKDIAEINRITKVGGQIESLKKTAETVHQEFIEIVQFLAQKETTQSFDIEITEGMLNQNYLSLKPMNSSPINDSVMPSEDIEFKVSFPGHMGTITTSYLKKFNRLKERGAIKSFFDEFGLMPGSIITFIQNKHNSEYSIEVKQKF